MKSSINIKFGPKELTVSRVRDYVRLEISETYTREEYIGMTGEEPKDPEDLYHREVILLDEKKDLQVLVAYLMESLEEI